MIALCKSPFELGLGLGDMKLWAPASVLYLIMALPAVFILTPSMDGFQQYYQQRNFQLGEYVFSTTVLMFGWEYLMRGFLIFGLNHSMKEGAILCYRSYKA
jgi:hypothetical protein